MIYFILNYLLLHASYTDRSARQLLLTWFEIEFVNNIPRKRSCEQFQNATIKWMGYNTKNIVLNFGCPLFCARSFLGRPPFWDARHFGVSAILGYRHFVWQVEMAAILGYP